LRFRKQGSGVGTFRGPVIGQILHAGGLAGLGPGGEAGEIGMRRGLSYAGDFKSAGMGLFLNLLRGKRHAFLL
jgi:hypothetical protein